LYCVYRFLNTHRFSTRHKAPKGTLVISAYMCIYGVDKYASMCVLYTVKLPNNNTPR